ncbi:MAG TPA: PLD nuclease N-terminal domain-containing protein [Parvibaculum sp.]|uniref:PLD nuclease N-terminal domain-containing protein n=1 Tax=Parvibaculum sp. TaxID=2024848 RepID=UPI002CA56DBB|nr:PLD nuclease N-terminal domain-containing protein [Parvibaculum sp.]HMM13977.1 PLD nuclease N-terminal domain-containing protein [Parvibaculum sp.]
MMLAHGYGGFIWLIVAILDVYAIVRIAQSNAEPLWKAIWIVVVLALPVIGLILWGLFGPKR